MGKSGAIDVNEKAMFPKNAPKRLAQMGHHAKRDETSTMLEVQRKRWINIL